LEVGHVIGVTVAMLNGWTIVAFVLKCPPAVLAFTAHSGEDLRPHVSPNIPCFPVVAAIKGDLRQPDVDGLSYVRPSEGTLKALAARVAY
jgi:hypothetical protein